MRKIDVDTKNRENKGFTLIELLGTIAVLAVIITIIIYSAMNIIDSAKEKSYKVTINNIQTNANNYVMEEISNTRWVYYDSDNEYQCVTVQNLMDAGYFKSDVLDSYVTDDRKVLGTDNIFLLRDNGTKSVTKNVLIFDSRFEGLCEGFDALGNIVFVSDNKWAKAKDIGIKYNVYNVDYISLPSYIYDYNYEVSGSAINNYSNKFSYFEENENLTVSKNGTLYASIKDASGYTYADNTLIVNSIDNNGPIISFSNNGTSDWNQNVSSKISVVDNESGVDDTTLKYIFAASDSETPNSNFVNNATVKKTTGDGYYYLIVTACDKLGNCSRKVSEPFKLDNTDPEIIFGTNGNSSWSKSASSKISVTDSNSGVDDESLKYIFSTSNNATSTIAFVNKAIVKHESGTGDYYLIASACDLAGNCSEKVSNIFKLDNTPPEVTFVTNGSSWSKTASSKISVTDSNSGVNNSTLKYIYSKNVEDTPNASFMNGTTVTSAIGADVKYLVASACDIVGNCTKVSTDDFKLDNTAPTITFGTNGNNTWSKSASSKITVTDNGIGVDESTLKYIFSTSSSAMPDSSFVNKSTVKQESGDGNYYLIVYACDKLGNCTTEVSNVFKLDNTGPTITLGTNGNNSWSKTASSKISVSDSNSGVDSDTLKYIFSTSSSATPTIAFTNSSTVSKSSGTGSYYLVVYACDVVGNCSDKISNIFKLDNTAPEITFGTNGTSKWVKRASSKISVSDSDSGVNTNTLKYIFSLDSNATATTSFNNYATVTISSGDGKYYLITSACDFVGNCITEVSNVFKIDNTPPVVACDSSKSYYEQHYSDGTTARIELGEYNQSYLLNSNYYISYDKNCSAFYYKAFKESNATMTSCSLMFNVSDNSGVISNKYCSIDYYDDDGNTEGQTKSGKDCIWRATSCNCIKGYCSAVYNYSVFDEAGNYAENEFTVYNMYENAPSLREKYCNAAGNASNANNLCIENSGDDYEAPTITFGTNGNSSWSQTAGSTITVTDSGSGVDESTLKYIFSTSSSAMPNSSFTNSQKVSLSSGDGYYYLIAYACDYYDNCTTEVSKVFKLDNTGPTITLGTNGNSSWSKSASSKISVIDSNSGVDSDTLKYIFSTSSSATPTIAFTNSSTVSKSSGTGSYYLVVSACDSVGNCSDKESNVFNLDNTAPTITFDTDGNDTSSDVASSKIMVNDGASGIDSSTLKYIFSTNSSATPNISFINNATVTQGSGSGSYYLIASACDMVGNCAENVTNAFTVDNMGPVITFGTNGNSSWSKTASSTIIVTDGSSEVDSSTLRYVFSTASGAAPNMTFTNGEEVTLSSVNGSYYLIAYACDVLGNCTKSVSNVFNLDNTAPTITFGTNGNSNWSKTASSVVTVTDNASGIDSDTLKYIYSTSSSVTPNTAFTNSSSVTLSYGTGEYYLIIDACDNAGNCANEVSNIFKLDNTSPTITYSISGTSTWVKSASSVITVTDSNSGVDNNALKYIFSTNYSETPTDSFTNGASVSIDSVDGYYYLITEACDVLGNCTIKRDGRFKIDNTPPEIHCDSSAVVINQWKKEFGTIMSQVPAENIDTLDIVTYSYDSCAVSTVLNNYKGSVLTNHNDFLYATDNHLLSRATYSYLIYNESWNVHDSWNSDEYESTGKGFLPYKSFDDGGWEWHIVAIDQAGNTSSGSFMIRLKYAPLS